MSNLKFIVEMNHLNVPLNHSREQFTMNVGAINH